MKKLPILMLSLVTLPSYGQGLLNTLNTYQGSLSTPSTAPAAGAKKQSGPEVKPTGDAKASTTQKCEEQDQTSLPLAYVTSLIQQKNATLELVHDPRSGTLSVGSADMISNCNSMLEWSLNEPEIQGRKAYALEVKIKKSDLCSSEGCTYKVAKVENGEFKEHASMIFKPTLKGFEECLQKSGVVQGGKVVKGAIYAAPIAEKFTDLEHTGKILFQSHGPSTPLIKAKYGKFEHVNACDYYETAHPQIKELLTLSDAESIRLRDEANKLKDCRPEEYDKISDFIEKNEAYAEELGKIHEKLLLEAVKKSAAKIASGKYSEEDLKVISDFEKFIVNPKIELARAYYAMGEELEGDAKRQNQEQLKKVLSEINALNLKPYFTKAHTLKLVQDGRFQDAEALNSLQLLVDNHKRLGHRQNNVVITPELASKQTAVQRLEFKEALEAEKEKYEVRTGQITGNAEMYASYAEQMAKDIQDRTELFVAEMYDEAREFQPGGHCTKFWVNYNTCKQESESVILALQEELTIKNAEDQERMVKYQAKAKEYAALEAQGRRYIAAQNGETVEEPKETKKDEKRSLAPTKRQRNKDQDQNGAYAFNFLNQQNPQLQQQAQQQAMMTPNGYQNSLFPSFQQNMFQQQQNPFGFQQQQPFLGQQSFPFQQNTFGFGGQQPQGMYNYNFLGGQQNQMPFGQGMNQQFGGLGQMPFQQTFGQMPYQQQFNYQYGFRY